MFFFFFCKGNPNIRLERNQTCFLKSEVLIRTHGVPSLRSTLDINAFSISVWRGRGGGGGIGSQTAQRSGAGLKKSAGTASVIYQHDSDTATSYSEGKHEERGRRSRSSICMYVGWGNLIFGNAAAVKGRPRIRSRDCCSVLRSRGARYSIVF